MPSPAIRPKNVGRVWGGFRAIISIYVETRLWEESYHTEIVAIRFADAFYKITIIIKWFWKMSTYDIASPQFSYEFTLKALMYHIRDSPKLDNHYLPTRYYLTQTKSSRILLISIKFFVSHACACDAFRCLRSTQEHNKASSFTSYMKSKRSNLIFVIYVPNVRNRV